jgi:3-oxoacyl-[acyl-carrier protein] reductase
MSAYFDPSGRVALVTGASQGLGRRFAEVLAGAGAAVGLASRQTDKLQAVKDQVESRGGRAFAVALDVTRSETIEQALATVEDELGPIDVLVNNAGTAIAKPFLQQSEGDWDKVVGTNLRGAFFVAQEGARRMAERGRGSIVNVASVLGLGVMKGLTSYGASKAGLIHLTRVMAAELARSGIRVNALAPGYIDTDMNRDFFETEAGRKVIGRISMRRLGRPEELDAGLLLLASDASSYMTGSVLVVDGGFRLE